MFSRPPLPSLAWVRDPKMKERSTAYYAHHFQCRACISAGQGNGNRCESGSSLWKSYQKV